MSFCVKDLLFSYKKADKPILNKISIDDLGGEHIMAVIGPNGSGKSTFLKCLSGVLESEGEISYDGCSLKQLDARTVAQKICYMPQDTFSNAMLTVFESVLLARKTSLKSDKDKDLAVVESLLESFGIGDLAESYISQISGGQQQLVALAQAISRTPKVLLLDEPTAALDLQRQLEVLTVLETLVLNCKMTCLIALHDLNLASRFAKRIVVMDDGRLVKEGPPDKIFKKELFRQVYNIDTKIEYQSGHPQIYPIRSIRNFSQNIKL